MPKGFYVSRGLAGATIDALDARTGQASGYRFHPSMKNPKLSRYEPDSQRTIPFFKKGIAAWAARDTDFFRPGFLPPGDDLVVIADEQCIVCYLAIVHRYSFDRSGSAAKYTNTFYDEVLWAKANWHMWMSVPNGAPAQVAEYTLAAIKHAGDTITSTGNLTTRLTGGAVAGGYMVMNPLFAGR